MPVQAVTDVCGEGEQVDPLAPYARPAAPNGVPNLRRLAVRDCNGGSMNSGGQALNAWSCG